MDDDVPPDLLEAAGLRGPLRELRRQSGRVLNEISLAQILGAENLITKAARHLAGGDAERAERLIERAAHMPYDPREESSPGVMGAQVVVHRTIADQLEVSPSDDPLWLDVVFAVYPNLDATAQADVASVVNGFALQQGLFDLTPAEARRIHERFGDAPLEPDLGDTADATLADRRAIIRSLAAAAAALSVAYSAAG